ncbi:MAG: hypothetical protein ACK55Z_07785, partial [bacterium]
MTAIDRAWSTQTGPGWCCQLRFEQIFDHRDLPMSPWWWSSERYVFYICAFRWLSIIFLFFF